MTWASVHEDALAAGRAIAAAHALPLVGAIVAYLAGVLAIGERLSAAARAFDATLPRLRAAAIGLSAVFASHVSFGAAAGETARLGWLLRLLHGRKDAGKTAVGILAIDRVADGLAIGAMVLLAALAGAHAATPGQLPILAVALVTLVVIAALILRRGDAIRRLGRGAAFAFPPAVLAWAVDLLRVYLVATAVGLSIGFGPLCAIALASLIGGQAPTPGGVGAVEAAMLATGSALGLPPGPLAATVLLDRLVTLSLGTGLGALCTTGLVRSSARRTA